MFQMEEREMQELQQTQRCLLAFFVCRLKKEGVKAGVPDIGLPVPRGAYHGLYIELKVGKNKTSLKQKEWISMLKEQGYFVEVCYGWIAAKEVIENYLKGLVK